MSAPALKDQTAWCLYDSLEEHTVSDLLIDEVKILLKGVAPHRLIDWVVLEPGEETWKPINKVRALNVAVVPTQVNVTPEEELALFGSDENLELDLDVERLDERRGHTRYKKEFRFVVMTGLGLKTKTLDVSMTGARLADPLPDWIVKEFHAVLMFETQKISVVARPASSKKGGQSIVFLQIGAPELLRNWLLGF